MSSRRRTSAPARTGPVLAAGGAVALILLVASRWLRPEELSSGIEPAPPLPSMASDIRESADAPLPIAAFAFRDAMAGRPAVVPASVIQVVDGSGVPRAGVPVAVLRVRDGSRAVEWRGTTSGPDGSAVLPASGFGDEGSAPGSRRFAALGFPSAVPAVVLETDALLAEPVRLALPPTAALEIRLVEADGSQFHGIASLFVGAVTPGPAGAHVGIESHDGLARCDFVGLGLELCIEVRAQGRETTTVRIEGPRETGASKAVDIRLPPAEPAVRIRLLDGEGRPLVRLPVTAFLHRVYGSLSWTLSTDDEGRIEIGIPRDSGVRSPAMIGPLPLSLWIDGGDRGAELMLPSELPPGPSDLGDVRLDRGPILVAGRVVDGRDRPVAAAAVKVAIARGSLAVSDCDTHRLKSDEDGAFALRLNRNVVEVRLFAEAEDHASGPEITVPPGTTDARILLRREGAIEASLRTHAGFPCELVRATLRRRVPPEWEGVPSRWDGTPNAAGGIRFGGLLPGTYALSLRAPGDPAPLGTWEGLVVAEGETTRDVRLEEIDLRDRVRTVSVTVLGPGGGPASKGTVLVSPERAEAAGVMGFTLDGGPLRILTSEPSFDLLIEAEGCRRTRVDGIATDRTIRVEPRIPVRVRFDPELARRRDGLVVRLELEVPGRDPDTLTGSFVDGNLFAVQTILPLWLERPRGSVQHAINASEALFMLDRPGTWMVRLRMERQATGVACTLTPLPASIEVHGDAKPQEISIAVTPESLAQALDLLGR